MVGASQSGFNRLFSLRQEFPTEWYRFAKAGSADDLRSDEVPISLRRFPFLFTGKDTTLSITSLALFVVPSRAAHPPVSVPETLQVFVPGGTTALQPTGDASIGPLLGKTFSAKRWRTRARSAIAEEVW